jgi:riboflavin kinase/FMN adenylyltransferase
LNLLNKNIFDCFTNWLSLSYNINMLVISWEDFLRTEFKNESAVTMGVFDGVHRGHRRLIDMISTKGLFKVVFTFRRNPLALLSPSAQRIEITSLDEKIVIFEELGVDTLVLIDFSIDFSKMSGADFIRLLIRNAKMRYFVVGSDFKCGHGASFCVEDIKILCTSEGVECVAAEPVMEGGRPVSSSRIRSALAAGDKETAEILLGRKILI